MRRQTLLQALAAILMTATAGMAAAQQVVVQPSQGQSSSQMDKDKGDCYSIAKQSTGYDPAMAAQTSSTATAAPPTGGRARGAAAGAAAGAVGAQVRSNQYENVPDKAQEEYRQNQAKSAAAAGAVVGGSRQRQDRRQQSSQQQQAAAQESSKAGAFNQAYSACLAGRGYQVMQQ